MNDYLLDTHIVLWLADNSPKLTNTVKSIVLDESAKKYVSVASCLEITIKLSLDKLKLEGGTAEFYRIVSENGFGLLDMAQNHLAVLETLPFHHRDPFDRLLIATAISENMILITADANIPKYMRDGLSFVL